MISLDFWGRCTRFLSLRTPRSSPELGTRLNGRNLKAKEDFNKMGLVRKVSSSILIPAAVHTLHCSLLRTVDSPVYVLYLFAHRDILDSPLKGRYVSVQSLFVSFRDFHILTVKLSVISVCWP